MKILFFLLSDFRVFFVFENNLWRLAVVRVCVCVCVSRSLLCACVWLNKKSTNVYFLVATAGR